jgi:hypothetical protein
LPRLALRSGTLPSPSPCEFQSAAGFFSQASTSFESAATFMSQSAFAFQSLNMVQAVRLTSNSVTALAAGASLGPR